MSEFSRDYLDAWSSPEPVFNITTFQGEGWCKFYLGSNRFGPSILGHKIEEGDRIAVLLDKSGDVIKVYIERMDGSEVRLDYRELLRLSKPLPHPKHRFTINHDFKLHIDPSDLDIDREGLIDSSHDIVACISTWLLSEEK